MSVITPNPCPNISGWSSSSVSVTLSASGVLGGNTNLVLSSFNLKLYKLPVFTSPTKMVFSYCFPSVAEVRNLRAVGATGCFHTNSGDQYFPLPSKSNK
jgi:hypothetical protein